MTETAPNGRAAAPPRPAASPRICWALAEPVNTPVASCTVQRAACGKTPGKDDALTYDRELVTCEACKSLLATGGAGGPKAVSAPAAVNAGWQPQAFLGLDEAALLARKAELEGELAGLRVLLQAVRARERARAKAIGKKAEGKKAEDGGAARD